MQRIKKDYSDLSPEQQYEKARETAHRILKSREKSSSELLKRLQEKGHDATSAKKVVQRFIDVGLIDDERYCELYIRNAQYSNKGWFRIVQELRQRGIEVDYLDPPLFEEELERAQNVIVRLPLETIKQREKALRRLVTKGHSYDVAKKAISNRLKEIGSIASWQLNDAVGNEHDESIASTRQGPDDCLGDVTF